MLKDGAAGDDEPTRWRTNVAERRYARIVLGNDMKGSGECVNAVRFGFVNNPPTATVTLNANGSFNYPRPRTTRVGHVHLSGHGWNRDERMADGDNHHTNVTDAPVAIDDA